MTNTAIARRLRHFLPLRLGRSISRHHPRLLLSKRSATATALIKPVSLTSHYVTVTGQIPSTSVHVSTAMADFTNDIHRPRLTSPPSEVFPSTGLTLSRPPIRHCIHCSPSDCSKFNPVPHPQYSIKVETSENAQEVKTTWELRAQARNHD